MKEENLMDDMIENLIEAIKNSGLDKYIKVQEMDKILTKYYKPLANSIIMFHESFNPFDTDRKVLWLIRHSSLFIVGRDKLRLVFDGYDLKIMKKFVSIIENEKRRQGL